MAERLNGYRILILETREEAQFSRLLTEQGADVVQCPMFEIHDAPDPAPVEAFISRFIAHPFDDLVLLTGEGLRRLMKVARRLGNDVDFVASLAKARKFTRGPKPGRALREIGLEPQATTEKPTSEGVAEMLSRIDLKGHRLALQLYPDKDHSALIGAIKAQGADVETVLPYVYDPKAADGKIGGHMENDGSTMSLSGNINFDGNFTVDVADDLNSSAASDASAIVAAVEPQSAVSHTSNVVRFPGFAAQAAPATSARTPVRGNAQSPQPD